ncbi:MAG TPA: molybdopterin-dependent oxidoreductase [Nocardioidaceae bacterium]|nr:molybdopterin-dependent oxidoreductase [Nocardioidaceae bacterium]
MGPIMPHEVNRPVHLAAMREHRGVTRRYALAGLVAGLSGIAAAYALTMLLSLRATPIQGVAEAIIEHTPGHVAESLIGLVGQWDKPLLVAGVTLGILGVSALAGVLARRNRLAAQLVLVAMGVVGYLGMRTRPSFSSYDLIPLLVGTGAWLIVLGYLADQAARTERAQHADSAQGAARADPAGPQPTARPSAATDHTAQESRRGFLLRAGVLAGASLVIAAGGQLAGQARSGVESARRLLRLPVSRGRVPAGAALDLTGLPPWRTPNDAFYRIDTALVVPSVDPTEWRLRIHGMVDRELHLTYRDLVERQLTEDWVTLCCVSNPVGGDLVGNAFWSGVRVADLLTEAGVQPGADAVLQTSTDDWTCGTPLAALTDDRNAMLAVAMNGEPLPVEHGFPVRMVVPGLYGYVSATKWLVDLEVTRFADISAYWTQRGWSPRGPIKTQSRIDVPRSGANLAPGPRRIGGTAWAQHTGIAQVEYRLDGQPWQRATLGRVPDVDTWVQWAGEVDLPPGEHTLTVRATDESGYTQTSVHRDVVPDGATGWHTITVTAG